MSEHDASTLYVFLAVTGWVWLWLTWLDARDAKRLFEQYREDCRRHGNIIIVLWGVVYRLGGITAVNDARRRLGIPEMPDEAEGHSKRLTMQSRFEMP